MLNCVLDIFIDIKTEAWHHPLLVFHQPVPALPGLRGADARARW